LKRKQQNQDEYSFQHTKQRALERYGMEISRADYDELTKICLETCGQPNGIVADEGDQIIVKTYFHGTLITAVVDNQGRVKTLLPKGK